MLPALFLLMFFNRQNIKFFIIIILTSVPLFLPVFMIWEGLVPPAQKHTAEGFVDIWHGILGFAYLSLFILIVSPGYFKIKRKEIPIYLIALVGFFILNLLIFKFQYSPLSITLSKFMPAAFMDFYPFLIAPMFGVIVLIFIVIGTRKLIENRLNPQFIFIMLCMILITATSFKITHLFSSRYVVQVAPFIVILSGYYESFNYGKHIRYIIGVVIGLLSYLTYANFHI